MPSDRSPALLILRAGRRLTEDLPSAHKTMETAAKLGISMKEVTDKLTDDGVRLFSEAFDKLLAAVEKSSKSK